MMKEPEMVFRRVSSQPFSFSRRAILRNLGVAGGASLVRVVAPWRLTEAPEIPSGFARNEDNSVFRVGTFKRIYDPSNDEMQRWYINDHTFIRARDGQWHLFGITHPEPANAQEEKFFAHATASDLNGLWTKRASVLHVDKQLGETVVWAPYVLEHDGVYWMYYCAGGKSHEKYHIHLATSADLFNWERHPANPMVVDGYDARDPMVLRYKEQWVLYYTATTKPQGGHHIVNAVTSEDLTHWSQKKEVFVDVEMGTYGGPTESPFVVTRNGKCYLFVCTNHGYSETAVYESDHAFHWDPANLIGKFPAHAAEVIQTPEGRWFVSRAGWGQGGVYLAELTWES